MKPHCCRWPVPLLGATLIWVAYFATRGSGDVWVCHADEGHMDVCALSCHLRPCWCLWAMPSPGAIPNCHLSPLWCPGPAVAEGHVWVHSVAPSRICADIHGPCYYWRPCECLESCWCQWSMLPPGPFLGLCSYCSWCVHGLCCCPKPGRNTQSMLFCWLQRARKLLLQRCC